MVERNINICTVQPTQQKSGHLICRFRAPPNLHLLTWHTEILLKSIKCFVTRKKSVKLGLNFKNSVVLW